MTRTGIVFMNCAAADLLQALRGASVTLLSLVAFIALPTPAAAQNSAISGVVKDPQQAVVAGAEVILRNSRSVATPTVITDGAGRYTFGLIDAGHDVIDETDWPVELTANHNALL